MKNARKIVNQIYFLIQTVRTCLTISKYVILDYFVARIVASEDVSEDSEMWGLSGRRFHIRPRPARSEIFISYFDNVILEFI